MMKLKNKNIGGDIVKDNDIYQLRDNTTLKDLILSSTLLHRGKQTTGHKQKGQEVCFFISGYGEMLIDDKKISVEQGDIVLIEAGEFIRVYNTCQEDLYFICVFHGKRN